MEDCPPPPPGNGAAGGGRSASLPISLRALNKTSHKISKSNMRAPQLPLATAKSEPPGDQTPDSLPPPPPTAATAAMAAVPQPQPPVYNINKNDFRDVVQKLTGSPVHNAAPARPAAVPASRLQKNRPPPLSQLGPRPAAAESGGAACLRPWTSTPLSPLPPLPTVSAAAESPITAYLRGLRGGAAAPGTVGVPLFPLPTSPLGFGCLPSPQPGIPSSPRLPVPSPKWEKP